MEINNVHIEAKELMQGVFVCEDDYKIRKFITDLGFPMDKLPKVSQEETYCIPFVTYDKGFNLTVVAYCSVEGDSGYILYHYCNFLTQNKVDVSKLAGGVFQVDELMGMIMTQLAIIANNINYPFYIQTILSPDFSGFIATANHPIKKEVNEN